MEKGPGAENKLRGKLGPNQLSLFFLRGPSEQQEGGVFSPVRCLHFVSSAPPLRRIWFIWFISQWGAGRR